MDLLREKGKLSSQLQEDMASILDRIRGSADKTLLGTVRIDIPQASQGQAFPSRSVPFLFATTDG